MGLRRGADAGSEVRYSRLPSRDLRLGEDVGCVWRLCPVCLSICFRDLSVYSRLTWNLLGSSGWPWTLHLPASASQVLGLQMCHQHAWMCLSFLTPTLRICLLNVYFWGSGQWDGWNDSMDGATLALFLLFVEFEINKAHTTPKCLKT